MVTRLLQKYLTKQPAKRQEWAPAQRTYLKDSVLANEIYDKGYTIAGRLDTDTIERLTAFYHSQHDFKKPNGGMFYSVYSRDTAYRRQVHDGVGDILRPVYDTLFHDYRSVLNSFIVKVSGPESEFCLHQDSTSIDEMSYSNLSVWIPLQDTDMTNGCICVVPYSHKMFSPYRGISFDAPFEQISPLVRRYLQPVILRKGDILLFDNRLVHNSPPNNAGADRIVIMSGIYPAGVPVISVYKDPDTPDSPIELIEQDDNYLIDYPNFLEGCRCRPETGRTMYHVQWDTRQMMEGEFLALAEKYKLQQTNMPGLLIPAEVQTTLGDRGKQGEQ